jgi:hypothetical protein
VAQALIDNPGMTEAEIRAAFQSTWEEQDCQNYISLISPNTWHGWSVPYINGNVATTAALAEQCPNGSPPSPLLCSPGQTTYWGIPKWVGDGTRVPDIRQLVLTDPATGDPVADALFAVGSQLGAINLGGGEWSFEIDCTDCDGNVETDCNSASRLDAVWYEKTVEVRESRPDPCNSATDELDLCPPQNCTIVAITVTRKKYCGSNANEITQEDSWTVEVAVCPCAFPFIMTTSDPIASEARGYATEADCVADWTCGGSAATACGNNQWKLVRHDTEPNGSDRQCMTYECESVTGCYPPFGCCG